MGALRRVTVLRIFGLAFAVVLAIGSASFAADPAVRYTIVSTDKDGVTVKGTIRIEVHNLTGGNMTNVDLRVAHPGPYSIIKGLSSMATSPGARPRLSPDPTCSMKCRWRLEPRFYGGSITTQRRDHISRSSYPEFRSATNSWRPYR